MAKRTPYDTPRTCRDCYDFTTTDRRALSLHIKSCEVHIARIAADTRDLEQEEIENRADEFYNALPLAHQTSDFYPFCEAVARRTM
jgi:hypothetical protein